jgi:DMSO/TMAO reductase YedYZ molybdopterin-dependent catalytic subunit
VTSASRGFRPKHFRRPDDDERSRVPPGQYVANGFPVLSAGPTPDVVRERWRLDVWPADGGDAVGWNWEEFRRLPSERVSADIHCVTRWSKLDTRWEGVSLDTLLAGMPPAAFVGAYCYGGYTTNLPLADVTGGKAWAVWSYDGQPLTPEHGGPVRLLVPHLYFWKSAKWLRGLRLSGADIPGFWESAGYHNYGDPWREQRYTGD